MNSTQLLEDEFFKKISDFFERTEINYKYVIVREPKLSEYTTGRLTSVRRPDFLILKGSYPYIIVEVVSTFKLDQLLSNKQLFNTNYKIELELTGADYIIFTDLEQFVLINTNEEFTYSRLKPFENFLHLFEEEPTSEEVNRFKIEIAEIINKIIQESDLSTYRGDSIKKRLLEFGGTTKLFDHIEYNSEGRFYHFKSNPEEGLNDYENLFFQSLLEPVTEQIVCRYTTLDSIYHMLNNKSYRMASHIAMNDRSEVDYVDKYVGVYYKPITNMSLGELQKLNNSYISSCTTSNKEDDLTMYRLYGDDSKGVCLVFNVINAAVSNNLLLRKISYAVSRDFHPELELLKNIINAISGRLKLRFRFQYIDVWKHFFKTFDYAVENEIRLLYLDNMALTPNPISRGWVIAQPDKLLSKFVMFDLNGLNFPLRLSKIILGPNCPEQTINRKQLEVFLNEIIIRNVDVENSKIESYRKS